MDSSPENDKKRWPTSVLKRDGTTRSFAKQNLESVITKAYHSVTKNSPSGQLLAAILDNVLQCLCLSNVESPVSVEVLQDAVERALTLMAPHEVVRHFIVYREHHKEKRDANKGYCIEKIPDDVIPPWGPLGYVTYKRTYARALPDGKSTETFRQTILRVLDAARRQLGVPFTVDELKQAYKDLMGLKGMVAGRFLWQLGTATVDRIGLMSLQNCAFVQIDEPIRPFTWIFDVLMLGCGVGVSVEKKNISRLPPVMRPRSPKINTIEVTCVDASDSDFIVPDKREGWVSLLEKVLNAFFYVGEGFTYSTHCIRGKGTPLKGFGGTASGPGVLVDGINNIVTILQKRAGQNLTSVDCLDIVDIIGSIVVAGNIRRSAILVIGDASDKEYLQAKRWDLPELNIPNWRAMSNNSVACSDTTQLPDEFWDGYVGNGEPYGLVNIELAQKLGRIADGSSHPDPNVRGFNPCAEQGLCNYETCCLAEIFLPNINSSQELDRVGKTLYRICKHSLALHCHHYGTERIVHANMRMGVGVTGVLQASNEKRAWLQGFYSTLRAYDKEYSQEHGFPESIKLTTVKPSGTLSLLAGVTSGIHPAYSQYMIRRIRISASDPLVDLCRTNGYKIESNIGFDGTADHSTKVVSFPCTYPRDTVLAETMSAIDQLETMRELQRTYSDNAVSCTVYYRLSELDDIRKWLAENYTENLKGCSFLLHNEHGFKQAPLEAITEEEYNKMLTSVKPITEGIINPDDGDPRAECETGHCPIK